MQTGVWKTEHGRIPNVVPGVGEGGQEDEDEDEDDAEEYEENSDGFEEDEQESEIECASEGLEQKGKGGWSPKLESIIEEM
jgi:hypothetical protein